MRYPLVPLLLLATTALPACGLVNIRVSDEVETTVERGTIVEELTGSMGFGELTAMDLFDSQELQNQGVEPGDVRDVQLVEFDLEATAPQEADLSFLQSLELYVEAPDLPRELVASQDDFPEGEPQVSLDLTELDLTEYVVSRSMTLRTEISGNRPDEDTDVTAAWALRFKVTSQGVRNQTSQD